MATNSFAETQSESPANKMQRKRFELRGQNGSNSRVRHTLLQANRKFDFNPCSGTNWHCAEEDGWGRAASVAPVLP